MSKKTVLKYAIFGSIVILLQVRPSCQHGRMLEPPARNTLWRFGFKAPPNYNDNELFCGGIGAIVRNDGKCGVCGDPYDGLRMHETGNLMALNVTARNFYPGSSIDLMIEIVANHGGLFTFDICWRDSWDQIDSEECFERLELSNVSPELTDEGTTTMPIYVGETEEERNESRGEEIESQRRAKSLRSEPTIDGYQLDAADGTGLYSMSVDLPPNRTCTNCILRWHWRTANNWGRCQDNTERVGCGHQEIYRNCADISVLRNGAGIGLNQRN